MTTKGKEVAGKVLLGEAWLPRAIYGRDYKEIAANLKKLEANLAKLHKAEWFD